MNGKSLKGSVIACQKLLDVVWDLLSVQLLVQKLSVPQALRAEESE